MWVLVVFVTGVLLDFIGHYIFYHMLGARWIHERLWRNFIEALIVGVFVFTLIDAKEKRIQRRFKELGYLNHHIRNALTIIEMAESNVGEAEKRLEMVKDASSRIRSCVERISRQEDSEINEKEPQKP